MTVGAARNLLDVLDNRLPADTLNPTSFHFLIEDLHLTIFQRPAFVVTFFETFTDGAIAKPYLCRDRFHCCFQSHPSRATPVSS